MTTDHYGYVALRPDDGKPWSIFAGETRCFFKRGQSTDFAGLRRGHIIEATGEALGRAESGGVPTFRDCANAEIKGLYISPQ
ncbi:MAG: hypothetical protein OXC95_06500 [Dehalococcoidia bacterium]|nr:hypothetical protein [Dehalococcoidia bacterium]